MNKTVYLRRKPLEGYLPKEVRAEATTKLSSVYVNRQPLKGFNPEEEKKFMQGILDVSPEHVEWPKHSKRFWAELSIPVGFTGVQLEIGVNEDGTPISIMDYIKYRFALAHPYVALTKAEMEKDATKRFYIQDLTREDKDKNNEIQFRKDADKEFIKLSSSPKNMARVLRLLTSSNPERMTSDQVENALYEFKSKNPKKFLRVATDKNLEMKAEIDEMISAGVLRKIGNQVIFIDEVLGDTMDDTVVHLKDKKNSGKLTILRSKLKELALK
jgi:hypothetical protein|tara:strand:- start:1331 stop:2143 length:813 start_codon:yes stop_codon:yes gene_type:complete